MLTDVHKIATAYLDNLERGETAYKEEKIEVESLASLPALVTLKRSTNPPFFYGFKSSGRPIFTHDLRLAKSFEISHSSVEQHVKHLEGIGENVVLHPTVWLEGRHRGGSQL